jgi:hypothetical protein
MDGKNLSQFSKGKIKKSCWNCGIECSNKASIERWGQSGKEANRSTMTKKEAVPTSCQFEKPAASLKDYFCWLMRFLVVQCSISRVRDARHGSIQNGKNLSQFSKGKKKIVRTVGSNVVTTRQSNDGDSLEKRQIAAQ